MEVQKRMRKKNIVNNSKLYLNEHVTERERDLTKQCSRSLIKTNDEYSGHGSYHGQNFRTKVKTEEGKEETEQCIPI